MPATATLASAMAATDALADLLANASWTSETFEDVQDDSEIDTDIPAIWCSSIVKAKKTATTTIPNIWQSSSAPNKLQDLASDNDEEEEDAGDGLSLTTSSLCSESTACSPPSSPSSSVIQVHSFVQPAMGHFDSFDASLSLHLKPTIAIASSTVSRGTPLSAIASDVLLIDLKTAAAAHPHLSAARTSTSTSTSATRRALTWIRRLGRRETNDGQCNCPVEFSTDLTSSAPQRRLRLVIEGLQICAIASESHRDTHAVVALIDTRIVFMRLYRCMIEKWDLKCTRIIVIWIQHIDRESVVCPQYPDWRDMHAHVGVVPTVSKFEALSTPWALITAICH